MSRQKLRLYCFSPPVMLITLLVEFSFAAYTLWRYKLTALTRLVVAILLLLGTFQLTEFLVCGGFGIEGGTWSRIGYGAITMLPALGFHLVQVIAKKKQPALVAIGYLMAGLFVVYFGFVANALTGHTCYANYVVFSHAADASHWYGLYYYGWLVASLIAIVRYLPTAAKREKSPLMALGAGYLAFMLPTSVINFLEPSTVSGIPSIMCGFAVILALVLTLKVTPASSEAKLKRR